MSKVIAAKHQVGISNTPANNFTFDSSANDGTMVLKRESGQKVLSVTNSGVAILEHTPYFNGGASQSTTTGTQTPVNITASKNWLFTQPTPTRVAATIAGVYLITANADFGGVGVGVCQTLVNLSNGQLIRGSTAKNSVAGNRSALSGLVEMQVGDYFEFLPNQDSGGNISVTFRIQAILMRSFI